MKLESINQKYSPFRVFQGVEISCNNEDFLILGVSDVRLESDGWDYPDLHQFVRERNGFIILAHPFRFRQNLAEECERFHPDAIEIRSANTPVTRRERILEIAQAWNVPTLCNSDAHTTEKLGSYYNILDETPKGEADLLNLLRAGRFRCSIGCS